MRINALCLSFITGKLCVSNLFLIIKPRKVYITFVLSDDIFALTDWLLNEPYVYYDLK